MKILHQLLIILSLLIIFTSCKKKNEETDYNPNLEAAKNDILADRGFVEVFNMLFKAANDTSIINNGSGIIDEAEIFIDSVPEITIKVRYPAWYIPCPDNRIRKGSYTANLSGSFNEPGTTTNVTFDDYHVQGRKLEGSMAITCQGPDQDNLLAFNYKVNEGKITLIDSLSSRTFRWECDKNASWALGSNTPHDFEDDVFHITGLASGISTEGNNFYTEVVRTVYNSFACWYLSNGLLNFSTPDLSVTFGETDYDVADTCTNTVYFYFNDNFFYHQYH